MKVKMKAEKLQSFILNGETIRVSELPEALRNEIDTMDRMSQDRLDKIYEVEICELALSTKKIQVMQAVKDYVASTNSAQAPAGSESLDKEATKGE